MNRSGVILIVILWILVILSVLAVGLGRRTSIDLSLTKFQVAKLKNDYLLWAGVMYGVSKIEKDVKDEKTSKYDTLRECGVALGDNETAEDAFKDVKMKEGSFSFLVPFKDAETGKLKMEYGLSDEERKINLNGINGLSNYKVLRELLMLRDVDGETAETIASSVVDWHDGDSNIFNPPYGAEDGDYANLSKPIHCKNLPFDSVEELLFVKAVTPEIFKKIKDDLTVFPLDAGKLSVNVNTAPEIVLRALGRSMAGPATNTDVADADSMAVKIINYRRGQDETEMTSDDRSINVSDTADLGFNTKEGDIFRTRLNEFASASRYIRLYVKSKAQESEVTSTVEAVVFKDDLSIVFWKRH